MSEPMKLLKSFRGRLMLLMTAFLLLTVVLVLGLDRWAQKRVSVEVRNQNERVKEIVGDSLGAFSESLSTALQNLNTEEYLYNRIAPGELPPDIKHIVVAEKDGKITDSTDRELVHKRILVPKSAIAQNQLGDRQNQILPGGRGALRSYSPPSACVESYCLCRRNIESGRTIP